MKGVKDRQTALADVAAAPEDVEQTTTEAAAAVGRVPNVVSMDDADRQFPAPEVSNDIPEWADLPGDLQLPQGAPVAFMLFKAEWTVASHKGDRSCILWPLTDRDERVAFARVKEVFAVAASELSKQMIRAYDGVKIDWSATPGKPGCLEDFWREIGPKCRAMVQRYYSQTHSMKPGEAAYFFEHCVAVRTMG